jgi:hypothetical protein
VRQWQQEGDHDKWGEDDEHDSTWNVGKKPRGFPSRAAGVCPDLADDEEGAYDIKDRSSYIGFFRIDAIVQNKY